LIRGKMSGEVGCKLRDCSRSVKHRVMEIGRAARAKGSQGKEKLQKAYGDLLHEPGGRTGEARKTCCSRSSSSPSQSASVFLSSL
jgi:hypothetical protein